MFDIINFRIVAKVLSRIFFIISGSLIVSAGVAIIYSEEVAPFFISAFITLLLGFLLLPVGVKLNKNYTMQRKDAYFTVTVSWFAISLVGCLPYLFSGAIPSFTDAFFESVSGFSTTGSSILTDIEVLPKSILFWRSLTHWIGGIGIIVLVIVIMPTLQIGGYHLFTLESSLQEKIRPKIKSVGYRLLFIYIGLTLIETIFLLAGKMSLFESVCHSFGTISTGGFSPKNTSIAGYSPYIQYVVMIFMVLAGTNFVLHYYLLKSEFKKIKRNEEVRLYVMVILLLGAIITAILFFQMNKSFEESFRESFFQVISIVTCTGFATADYMIWPQIAWVIIFFSMFLGGSTGSTAGGIKIVRHLVLLKNLSRTFRHLVSPNSVLPTKLNGNHISDDNNNSILTFILIYLMVFVVGSLVIIAIGVDPGEAASMVATSLAGIGPGIGSVGPVGNFAHIPEAAKMILPGFMILGRLEIYTVLVLFSNNFWRK